MKKLIIFILFSVFAFGSQSYKDIKFTGLTQISNEIALEITKFKKDKPYTEELINKSIKKFYKFNYFTDITVTSKDHILSFNFTEKPFIANLSMSGYKTRDDDLKMLFEQMNIKKGNMYSKKKIKTAKKLLLDALKNDGYVHSVVEVEVKKINKSSVSVKFLVNKGDEIIIKKFTYNGAKKLSKDTIEENTVNKQIEPFSWWFGQNDGVMNFDQLEYDGLRIREAYLENGFLDAKVDKPFSLIDFNTNTATIDINIKEGKQYKVNNIVIYVDPKTVDVKKIYPKLRSKKGKIFNIKKLRKDIAYIKEQVANKGYAFAKVKYDVRKDIKKGTADLIFNVTKGDKVYINDVIISGNTRTLDRVIRRNVYLAPGDLFNLTDFKDSRKALKRTGFFESVSIKQQRISKTKMDLLVDVKEGPTGNLVLGGGYGSYDGWMINASINDRNIFGSGLNLGFSIDHSSKTNTLNLSLKNPAIRDSIYNGSINIYNKESTITAVDDTDLNGDEVTTTNGGSIGVGRSFGRHIRSGILYSLDNVDVDYELTNTEDVKYTTSAITPYISYNNTDDYFIPRTGHIASTSLKIAGIGGDAKYKQSSTSYKYFYSLEDLTDKDWILRYKTNVSLMQDDGYIPAGITYYLGGVGTVRGYESYAFQPDDDDHPFKRRWTNSVELSFPLIPKAKMRWALFYDYGMIGENKFDDIVKAGKGVVISWYSPVGPIQFIFSRAVDAGPNDNTSSFEFSLGSKF